MNNQIQIQPSAPDFLNSLSKKTIITGIESLLTIHPKKKFKYPSEERKKYACLHEWYKERIKLIQNSLQRQQVNIYEAVKEKQQILLLTMREFANLAYQQCEEKGCLLENLASHQLEFNNNLIRELDKLLKRSIEQRKFENQAMEFQYEDKIKELEEQLKEVITEKENKWRSMFLLIKDNRVLRRARGKLMREFQKSTNRQKRLQQQILQVTRENQKYKAVMDMEEEVNMKKILSNMINLQKLEVCVKKYPTKAKKVLDHQLQNLQINQLQTLSDKIEYISKAIDEAEELVDYYEDLHDLISEPKLLLNNFTQTNVEFDEKGINTQPLPTMHDQMNMVKAQDFQNCSIKNNVVNQIIQFSHIFKKRNHSIKTNIEKRNTGGALSTCSNQQYYFSASYKRKIQQVFSEKILCHNPSVNIVSTNLRTQRSNSPRKIMPIKNRPALTINHEFDLVFGQNDDELDDYESDLLEFPRRERQKRRSIGKNIYRKRNAITQQAQFKMREIIEEQSESSGNTSIARQQEFMIQEKTSEKIAQVIKIKVQEKKEGESLESIQKNHDISRLSIKSQTPNHDPNSSKNSKTSIQNNSKNLVKTTKKANKEGKYRFSGFNASINKKTFLNDLPSDHTITAQNDARSSSNDLENQDKRTNQSIKKIQTQRVNKNRISLNFNLKPKFSSSMNSQRCSIQRQFFFGARKSQKKLSGFATVIEKQESRDFSQGKRQTRSNSKKNTRYYIHDNSFKEGGNIKSFQLNKMIQKIMHNLYNKRKDGQNMSTMPHFISSYLKLIYGNNQNYHLSSFYKALTMEMDPSPTLLVLMKLLNIHVPWVYLKDLMRIYMLLFEKSSRENLTVQKEHGQIICNFIHSIFYKPQQKQQFVKGLPYLKQKTVNLNELFLSLEHTLYKHSFETQFAIFCKEILHPTEHDLNFTQLSELTLFLNDNLQLELHLTRLKCYCLLNRNGNADNSFPIHKISIYSVRQCWIEFRDIKTTILKNYRKIFKDQSEQALINFIDKRFLLVKDECPWLLRLAKLHLKSYRRYKITLNKLLLMLLRLTQFNLQIKKYMPISESFIFVTNKCKRLMIMKEIEVFKQKTS